MTIEEILGKAQDAGVEIFLSAGKLRAKAAKGKITSELKDIIKSNKDQLTDYLANEISPESPPQSNLKETTKFVPWLSYAQQRLWFIDQLGGGSVQYNIPGRYQLYEKLDLDAFKRAVRDLINRHEVLRTHFATVDGEPRQIITGEFNLPLVQHDLTDLKEEEKQQEAKRIIEEEASGKFDLCRDLMIRVRTIKLSKSHYIILYTLHHIASDGWSMGIFQNELGALYSAYSANRDNPLTALRIQYADYALWQRDWLKGEVLEKQLEYWNTQLSGVPNVHNLPLDKPRAAEQTFNANRFKQVFNPESTRQIRSICQQNEITLFIFLQTVFALAIARFSNEKDIVMGTPIAGRTHKDVEGLIGFFVNSLVLRTDLSSGLTFSELLKNNRDMVLEAFTNQHVPFEMLVEEIRPERDLSYNPVFQILFAVQNNEKGDWDLQQTNNSATSTLKNQTQNGNSLSAKTRFDLELHVYETESELSLRWVYNSALFEESSIRNLANSYRALVENIVGSSNGELRTRELGEFEVINEKEKRKLLIDWNDTGTHSLDSVCIHELFERQVDKTPNNLALIYGDQTLSYLELNKLSNQMAHCLIEHGVKVGDLVAFCIERSLDMVIGILGILKAGGAYVPLDSSYPVSRLQYMLDDCGTNLLVSRKKYFASVDQGAVKAIFLTEDNISTQLDVYSSKNLNINTNGLTSNSLAYAIYTSGSTGKPKGVKVAHQSVVNYIKNGEIYFQPNTLGTVVSTSLVFDATVCSLYLPLCYGKYVELITEGNSMIDSLIDYLIDDSENLLFKLTPSHLKAVLNSELLASGSNAKHVLVVGGEQLTQSTLSDWSKLFPESLFINEYGPTETTVGCSVYAQWAKDGVLEDGKRDIVPVGQPISNTQLYVVNEQFCVQPVGVSGELYIGGSGVTQGYINRPGLTAERFVPDPFSNTGGARLYQSGDSVRWLQSGNLEFIDRLDDQVKIRGFRIELGEVESGLAKHSSINNSVVIARTDDNAGDQLIAYLSPTTDYLEKAAQKNRQDNVTQWTSVFDDTYTDPDISYEVELNFAGWNSSYTAQEIPIEQMQEWLFETMRVIESIQPKNLLEIGCGTGLLLFRYAEQCEAVRAVDISAAALSSVQHGINHKGWEHVELMQGDALSVIDFPEEMLFDTVVINSVAQYFPNQQYLDQMIDALLSHTEEGGHILLGDIRNLDLLEAHSTAVERSRLTKSTQIGVLSNRVQRRIQQEQELLVSPSFFTRLQQKYTDIERVDILVKRGEGDNEMVRYRYEVLITKRKQTSNEQTNPSFEWFDFSSRENLIEMLEAQRHEIFGVSGIVNGRVSEDVLLSEEFRQSKSGRLIHLEAKSGSLSTDAIEQSKWLESALRFAEQNGYQCGLTWSQQELQYLDIIFSRVKLPEIQAREDYNENYLTNYPQLSILGQELSRDVKQFLDENLPAHMIPDMFVVLERLPLTSNGKVDKNALPLPNEKDLQKEKYVAPTNDSEERLCKIWEEILKLDNIGIHDNFFSLGGHSLLATRLISAIRQEFKVELQLRTLFESPTVATLSESLSTLGKDFILPPIEVVDRNKSLSLSYAQQRLWFIDQLGEGSLEYNMRGRFQLQGTFKSDEFKLALKALLERHEVLRTHYISENGEARQVIVHQFGLPLTQHDLSLLTDEEKEKEATRLMEEEAKVLFNLSNDLMLRVKVLKLSADRYTILYTIHHIAGDGWSIEIFKNEFISLYQAFCEKQDNPLQPLTSQYADYAQWQRNWLQGAVLEQQLDYWKKQLSNIPPVHSLPLDKVRPATQTHSGRGYKQLLDKDMSQKIKSLCKKHDVTLFMFLQTAFAVLLSRYSNQTDIVVGSPVSGRNHTDVEKLIGFFVNTLVLRTDLSGNPTFKGLLERNKKVILDAHAHQHVPFEMLVENILQERDLSYSPLFQILIDVQKSDFVRSDMEKEIQNQDTPKINHIPKIGVRFDIALHVHEYTDEITVRWSYRDSLFEDSSIYRMAINFEELLVNLVKHMSSIREDVRIGNLDIVAQPEVNTLLVDWNNTSRDYPKSKCLQTLFEEQVERTPDNVAIIFEERKFTYRDLNNRANQLAHYLIELGVKPDSLVALNIERSPEMMIAILGVMKSGGAYVPVDPKYPSSRIEYILGDSGALLVITQSHLVNDLHNQRQILCLDDQDFKRNLSVFGKENIEVSSINLTSSNLAYVIYTSGSTGKPKGVMINHSSVCNFLYAVKESFISKNIAGSVVSSPLAFDATVQSLYLPLCVGKYVQILPDDEQIISNLGDYLIDDEDDLLFKITPTHLKAVYTQGFVSKNPEVNHTIVVAGEQLTLNTLGPWQKELLPGARFINEYGPTEATVGSCIFNIPKSLQIDSNDQGIPIGKPLANVKFYVLNEYQKVQPIGAAGELYIGGEGLAREYLNKTELTKSQFVKNKFLPNENERMYKTGDLVRWLPDGNISFLGRIDDQVKIRGFRIELGEIENVILQQGSFKDTVVIAREDKKDDMWLVAYVVISDKIPHGASVEQTQSLTADNNDLVEELRSYLQTQLPVYMEPSVIVILPELPLTANGKVNKNALPAPGETDLNKEDYSPPRNSVEEVLCSLWEDILKIDKVGIHDNFFSLGGHSLLATRLISLIRQEFKIELQLRVLFESPTVACLSESIETIGDEFVLPPITLADRDQILPLSFAQQRLWFIDQLGEGSLQYNMPGRYLLEGEFKVDAFKRALKSLLDRHEVLRTHFTTMAGESRQVTVKQYTLPFVWQDLSNLSEQKRIFEVEKITKKESTTPFDLSKNLMLRVRALKISDSHHLILYTLHHIASDGWSMGILQNELSILYASYSQDQQNTLAPLNVQYVDYAIWQREWLQGNILKKQLSYWHKQLANIPSVHSFPLDKIRPKQQTYEGMRYRQVLNKEMTKSIKNLCEQHEVTLFMFLQTVFALLLSGYNDDENIVMGTPIAGRTHKDVEGLIGFFVNSLVLRTELISRSTFSELLMANKQMILDAYAHQHIPFEMLVEELNPERSLSFNPIFQMLFSVQNNEQGSLDLRQERNSQNNNKLVGVSNSVKACSTRFDFELQVSEANGGLIAAWVYNVALFDEEKFLRLSKNYEVLLTNIIESSSRKTDIQKTIEQLGLISEEEKHKLLVDWNDTAKPFPDRACIHELFEQQAKSSPNNIALCHGEEQLTYRELNEQSNYLAHALISKGVCLEMPIGICIDKSIEWVIGMLGILKSGGAYLQLDPKYPQLRMSHLIEDSGMRLIVTKSSLLESFAFTEIQGVEREISCLTIDGNKATKRSRSKLLSSNPGLHVNPLNLASVKYTLEQNIEPEGSSFSHISITSLIAANNPINQNYDEAPEQLKDCSFEPLNIVIWKNLANGIGINIAKDCSNSKQTATLSKRNFCATISSQPNTTIYVVKDNKLAPIGATGELYVGGTSLSRGFLGKGAKTAERFVPNQFSKISGERLYRTGELVRYLTNGNLEFVDRFDRLAKYRDTQIDLAKIEKTLLTHRAIKAVKLISMEHWYDKKQLACYVVSTDCGDNNLENNRFEMERLSIELRQQLKKQPTIMKLPVYFKQLESIPLTDDGRLDTKALPILIGNDVGKTEYVAPRNRVEETLCQLWQDSLNLEKVGIHDNFFALGGHSLMATRLVSLIRQEFNTELQIKALFETPTVAALSNSFGKTDNVFVLPPVKPVDRDQAMPLSFAQQRLWFIDQLGEGSTQYNMRGRLSLYGEFNTLAFKQALQSLLERHEVLRTHFITVAGEAQQVIVSDYELPFIENDLSLLGNDEKANQVRLYIQEESWTPFNLNQDLMLRVRLLRLSNEENLILYTMHHIASDGWSRGILQNELSLLYNAYSNKQINPLAPLKIQYADYAIWQRNWLQGEVLETQLNYWKKHLEGIPTIHGLLLDKPRPTEQTFIGKRIHQLLDKQITEQVNALCVTHEVTLFMFLQTAFTVLLGRYSNETDIVVGSPIAGRTHADIEALIGCFINSLVLRTDLSKAETFSELLRLNKGVILDAYAHQHIPFEMLVDELRPERHLNHNPVAQIYFVVQNNELGLFDQQLANRNQARKGKLLSSSKSFDVKFDLELTVTESDASLSMGWVYNESLFDEVTISHMAANYKTLIVSIIDNLTTEPEESISGLTWLAEEQKKALLYEWNSPQANFSYVKSIHELFEEQADKNPNAIALVHEDKQLSYGELNDRANRLAHYLIEQGVKAESRVGLWIERSLEMIIGLLGILKARGCYIPLDPEYPALRLAYLIRNSEVNLILTSSTVQSATDLNQLDDIKHSIRYLALDQDWGSHGYSNSNPVAQLMMSNLAYIIYTSGSSGEPKGVGINHSAWSNLAAALTERFKIKKSSRVLQFSSLSFDAAAFEISTSLTNGAALCLLSENGSKSPEKLTDTINKNQLTHTVLPPAILIYLNPNNFAIKTLIVAGEAISPEAAAIWAKGRELYNAYGPTETTVCATAGLYENGNLNMGRPLPNECCYVLDKTGEMLPAGVPGELHVSGIQLARGYIEQAKLTAESFVPHPFSQISGERLYRTGDLVRYLSDGNLEFIGRVDDQVKIRGFRIELGEVEQKLLAIEGVCDVAVVVYDEGDNDKRLVAYIVKDRLLQTVATSDKEEMTFAQEDDVIHGYIESLAKRLPGYMVPQIYLFIDRLPLTVNGKLDRRALPNPSENDLVKSIYAAPENQIERQLCDMWQELLKVEQVGIDDDFFSLGGHSLLATRLINLIRLEFETELPLRALFESPTIRKISKQIFLDVSERKILENEKQLMSSEKEIEEGEL